MVAVYLSPLYILISVYLLHRFFKWLVACHGILGKIWVRVTVVLLYIFVASAMVVGFFLPNGRLERFMKLLGHYWLGVMLYTVLTVGAADMIALVLKKCKRINQEKLRSRKVFVCVGALCILIIAGVSTYGVLNARVIHTTHYEIEVPKDGGKLDSLRVALVADLHMGYNIGCARIGRMVERINAIHPDLVVIAGDLFDNEYEALEDEERLSEILRGIESKYGVYACYGNHDIEEKILAGFTFGGSSREKMSSPKMDEFLERSNIRLLRDEYVLIDDSFYLYGRPDAERPGRGIVERKTAKEITEELDLRKPLIVIDHEPKELQELSDAGVDVDLCGHTHDGQTFPVNLTCRLTWENACGYLKKGNMHNIVTSGVGLFGPNMRVGTIAEVCEIEIGFKPTPEKNK